MTKEELEEKIADYYNRLHDRLFSEEVGRAKIELIIITENDLDSNVPNLVSAYWEKDNKITIAITKCDLH